MKLPSLFKTRKNKTFNYIPRYYNPRNDRALHKEEEKDIKLSVRRVRFKEEWKAQRQSKSDKASRIRVIVIALLLFVIFSFVLRHLKLVN